MKVKKILLTTTGLIALGMAPAIAADLPARAYTKAPAAAIAINNWTGFYLGAMGGYAQENTSDAFGEISGGFAGGTAGYNWQTGNFVLGVEVDGAWADVGARIGNPAILARGIPYPQHGHRSWPRRLRIRSGSRLRHRRLCMGRQPHNANRGRM